MKLKYKVGDKVRVRKDLIDNKLYGVIYFYPCMNDYKGQILTISNVFSNFYEVLENDNYWSDETFEDYTEDTEKNNTVMTVEDLLNKTDVEKGGLIITIYYPNANFDATIGHNKINRNSELYRRFIKAYGDMIVDEVSFDIRNDNMVVMLIKVDYAD